MPPASPAAGGGNIEKYGPVPTPAQRADALTHNAKLTHPNVAVILINTYLDACISVSRWCVGQLDLERHTLSKVLVNRWLVQLHE